MRLPNWLQSVLEWAVILLVLAWCAVGVAVTLR